MGFIRFMEFFVGFTTSTCGKLKYTISVKYTCLGPLHVITPIPSNSNKDMHLGSFGYGFKSPPATNHSGVVALKKIEQ